MDETKKKLTLKKTEKKTGEKAQKAPSQLLEKAKKRIVKAVDQNDDGKIDVKDISSASKKWSEKRELNKREAEIQLLRPLFEDDLVAPTFNMPKMVRVIEMDKKHSESNLCTGSLGHESEYKGLRVVNIYPQSLSSFGLSFDPDLESDLYYVDPCDRDHYISLDQYFEYLKIARVGELQKIAQDLGAKHFKVTYKEYEHSSSKRQLNAKSNVKAASKAASSNMAQMLDEIKASKVEIKAEMDCIGHKPVEPKLVYFKRDPQIQNLVSLRMSDNPITHQLYTLKMSNTSGIKAKDAADIDAAVSLMKAKVSVCMEKEAESENHRYFEYEIDF